MLCATRCSEFLGGSAVIVIVVDEIVIIEKVELGKVYVRMVHGHPLP